MKEETPRYSGMVHQAHTKAQVILDLIPQSYSEQLGISLKKGTPAPMYQWLVGALLFSAKISTDIAIAAGKSLFEEGLTTPRKMRRSTWEHRTKILNESGYARYDEKTSRMLEDTSDLLMSEYGGDLRKLREEAHFDSTHERCLLQEFKGIGETGTDIFLRDAQVVWEEHYPFVDEKAFDGARTLGLPLDARKLSGLVSKSDFPRLLTGLFQANKLKGFRREFRERVEAAT